MLAAAGGLAWNGGGLAIPRLDREGIAARAGQDLPRWLIDALLDPYEAAHLAGLTKRPPGNGRRPAPRTRTPEEDTDG